MLRITKASLRSADYYLELANADYFLKGGEPPGQWFGQSAGALGLEGQVDAESFLNLFKGFSPDGQTKLVQNAGQMKGYHERVPGFDLTFSAPKSVSVFWSQAPDWLRQIIQDAHRESVEEVLRLTDELAAVSRCGKGGKVWEKVSLLSALFEHGTSRAEEPQLHTHVIVFNLGFRKNGKTAALRSNALFEHEMAFGALYRAEFARRLGQELGLTTEAVQTWFELEGVSRELIDLFSSRRKEILAFCEEHSISGAKATEMAAIETRKQKSHISRNELFARWQQIGMAKGWSEAECLSLLSKRIMHPISTLECDTLFASALASVAGESEYFAKSDLIKVVAQRAQNSGLSANVIVALVEHSVTTGQIVSQGLMGDKEMFAIEKVEKVQQEILNRVTNLREEGEQTKTESVSQKAKQTAKAPYAEWIWEFENGPDFRNAAKIFSDFRSEENEPQSKADQERMWNNAKKAWTEAGFTVIEIKGSRLPMVLIESKEVGISLEAHGKRIFEKPSKLNPIWDVKIPFLTVNIEEHARFGPVNHSFGNRFFTIEELDKFPFASAMKANKARGFSLPSLRIRFDSDPFGFRLKLIVVIDEVSKLTAWQIKSWAKIAIASGAGLLGRDDSSILPTAGLLKRIEEGRNGSNRGKRIEVGIGDTKDKTLSAMIRAWSKKGILAPQANLMFTMTKKAADALNKLAQRERLLEGQLGREFVMVGKTPFHRKDRVRFDQAILSSGIREGAFGTVTNVSHKELRVFLDDGRIAVVALVDRPMISLGYSLTHWEAARLQPARSFILFEGQSGTVEVDQIKARNSAGKVRVFGQLNDIQRGNSFEKKKKEDRSQHHKQSPGMLH